MEQTKGKTEKPKLAAVEKKAKLTSEELANEIVLAISNELHLRVGIGPIWRQLNYARKKEIMDAWRYNAKELIEKNK